MKRRIPGDSGIVHHDINRPEILFDLCQTFRNGIIIRDIELVAFDAEFFGAFIRGLLVAGEIRCNRISLVLHGFTDRSPDTARASSDQSYSSHHVFPPVSFDMGQLAILLHR